MAKLRIFDFKSIGSVLGFLHIYESAITQKDLCKCKYMLPESKYDEFCLKFLAS